MNRYTALACVFLLSIIVLTIGCIEEQATKIQDVTFDQLFTDPDQYDGCYVTIDGFYFNGFEIIVLSEKLEYSGEC